MGSRAFAAVGAVVLAACVIAQGPPPGPGPGGPPPGPRHGGELGLLMRADVQRDIGLTSAQKTKLAKIQRGLMAQFQRPPDMSRRGGEDRMRVVEKSSDQVSAVLTSAQKKRLLEISIQLMGVRAATRPEVARSIGVTTAQQKKIAQIEQSQRPPAGMVRQGDRGGPPDFDALRKQFEKRQHATDAAIAKVLTPAQKQALKKMGGRPFKADANPQMPFPMGRPPR